MRRCSKCRKNRDESEFYHYGKYVRSKCNVCQKRYMRKYNKSYGEKNRDKLVEYQRNLRKNGYHSNKVYRDKFLKMYGNKCECCGEIEPVFLALDHIQGVNRRLKSSAYHAYVDAVTNFDPNEYRILCHNCNQATKGGRTCPHKIKTSI